VFGDKETTNVTFCILFSYCFIILQKMETKEGNKMIG